MGESSLSNLSRTFHDELTGRIMVVGIVLLFFVIAFVIFLHLYAKWYWYRREEEAAAAAATTTVVRRRRRLDFAPGYIESAASATGIRRGLDSSVLKSIPVVKFNSKELEKGLECAVCLSELVDGEKARLLPKCNHGFHVDCIDMWFQSHSTCPLCRNPIFTPISNSPEQNLASILQPPRAENSAVFPTNVLFWGSQAQVSTLSSAMDEDLQASATVSSSSSSSPPPPCQPNCSSSSSNSSRSDGMLVIDIPRQIVEDEEQKSPVTTRFRSLKRLLSRDRRVNPCSPSGDAE